jgi:dienelactone hydrolase
MKPVVIPVRGEKVIEGDLAVPEGSHAIVIFAHGSGSSRHSPRNKSVARVLNDAGIGTLLIDLLTADEEAVDESDGHLRFDIPLLSARLEAATDWIVENPGTRNFAIGYFGASTGAAAALVAAAKRSEGIRAVVLRGGRPDLAGSSLSMVGAPTLLIVGENDPVVIQLNRQAASELRVAHKIEVVPGATHLFEEPGALETVARLARLWFESYLVRRQIDVA